jgi:hypothetical protein
MDFPFVLPAIHRRQADLYSEYRLGTPREAAQPSRSRYFKKEPKPFVMCGQVHHGKDAHVLLPEVHTRVLFHPVLTSIW